VDNLLAKKISSSLGSHSLGLYTLTMRKILQFLLIILFCSCGSNWDGVESLGMVSSEIQLQENIKPTAPIKSFDLLEDESIVAINENGEIIRYSKNGEQVKFLSQTGTAELELSAPSHVEAFMNGYVVWDEELFKMVEFNQFDQPIREYKGFDHAIKGFKVDINYIYTYINPLPNQGFIQVYDKAMGSFKYRMGNASNADILANLNKCGGGMTIQDQEFVFISSASLEVFRVNRSNTEKVQLTKLDIPEIEFKNFEGDPVDIINGQRQKAFELSMSSSIITGIYDVGDQLLITGETGSGHLDGLQLDLTDRKQFYLLLNSDMKVAGLSYEEFDYDAPCKLWKDANGYFVRIIRKEGDDEYEYYLEKLSISK
jgi:hypothetical protein